MFNSRSQRRTREHAYKKEEVKRRNKGNKGRISLSKAAETSPSQNWFLQNLTDREKGSGRDAKNRRETS